MQEQGPYINASAEYIHGKPALNLASFPVCRRSYSILPFIQAVIFLAEQLQPSITLSLISLFMSSAAAGAVETAVPSVPSPDSSQQEVRDYLTTFFKNSCDEQAALDMASKCDFDGYQLYQASAKRLKEFWPDAGEQIYLDIQFSKYGHVSSFQLMR